jgi:hypothetical protein
MIEVTGEGGLELPESFQGLFLEVGELSAGGVESLEFVEAAAEAAEAVEQGVVFIGELGEGGLAELEEARGVPGSIVFLDEGILLAGLEARGFDFADLMAEEIELAGVGLVVNHEFGDAGVAVAPQPNEAGEGFAGIGEVAESVKDGELAGGVEEGLVFVGSVEVDEAFTEFGERGERGGGTVDELAVGAGCGEGAFEGEAMVFARFQAVGFEERGERSAEAGDVEDSLDCAVVAAGADEGAVCSLAEGEAQGADQDRLAGAGFAGQGGKAWGQIKAEIGHEREVLDAQRCEHVGVEWRLNLMVIVRMAT